MFLGAELHEKIILAIAVIFGEWADIGAQVPPPPVNVTPAEAAAGKIKAEEAGAKNRRAAVRYLGTVDWHYYPEAEAALIAALRADRNELVRIEAAHSLGNGYCTKKGIEALEMVLAGSEIDGNPAENSERVKATAQIALQHSMPKPPPPPTPEPAPKLPTISISRQPAIPSTILPVGYKDERSFAENFGCPRPIKLSRNFPIPEPPRRLPREYWVYRRSGRFPKNNDSLPVLGKSRAKTQRKSYGSSFFLCVLASLRETFFSPNELSSDRSFFGQRISSPAIPCRYPWP